MPQPRPDSEAFTCYAMTAPGLETIAAREIAERLKGEIKRTAAGLIVFRPRQVDRSLLALRTVEDVFLLLWGTDELTYRASDLDNITRWTARQPKWPDMLQLHHSVRPKPKGKPTYHLVTQMMGHHGYRRVDAAKAMARGLAGKFPASWKPAEENAAVEVWLTIHGASAVCGLRLSDRTMRHREYKREHLPASLRPVVAAAMVRLAGVGHEHRFLDPMCGVGTILGECLAAHGRAQVMGGDLEIPALRAAQANLRRLGQPLLARWDARQLPLANESIDRVACNPPFGKQLATPEEIGPLYEEFIQETDRVLKPGGRAVLLVSDTSSLDDAARACRLKRKEKIRLRILGQPAALCVYTKSPV